MWRLPRSRPQQSSMAGTKVLFVALPAVRKAGAHDNHLHAACALCMCTGRSGLTCPLLTTSHFAYNMVSRHRLLHVKAVLHAQLPLHQAQHPVGCVSMELRAHPTVHWQTHCPVFTRPRLRTPAAALAASIGPAAGTHPLLGSQQVVHAADHHLREGRARTWAV